MVDTAQLNFRKLRIWTEFYPRPSKDLNHKMQSKVLSEKKCVEGTSETKPPQDFPFKSYYLDDISDAKKWDFEIFR